ncbi:MAG: DUF2071 domain-containing protein [Syntrophorhabdus sp.]
MDITDVLYLTYLVPESRLRPAVPEAIPFAMAHHGKTFLSLVIFHTKNARASFFPFLSFNYDQVNVRCYVRDPVGGQPAAFFLHSGITSRSVSCITRLLKIPWPAMSLSINATYRNETVNYYSAEGAWNSEFLIELKADAHHDHDYAPFTGASDTAECLTSPAIGFYKVSGGVIRFEVEHESIVPSGTNITSVQFPLLEALGFLTKEEMRDPHSALVTPHAFFRVMLPPRMIPV